MTTAQQFAKIYDKLNGQPDLQDIIKQEVLEQIVKEQGAKATKNTIDELKYHIRDIRGSYDCYKFWTNPKSDHQFASYLLWQYKNIFNQ